MSADTITAVLGSSVVVAIVTSIYNYSVNQRNNTIVHITDERKAWRDKIRDISGRIYNTKFKGEKEEDINCLLVELELNINVMGKLNKQAIEKDSHIWETIEKIEKSESELEFEK